MSRHLLAAVAALSLTAYAAGAEAQIPSLGSMECDAGCTVAWIGGALGGTALAITEVVLFVDGMIKAGHGHGVYEAGGIGEVLIGLAHLAPVAIAAWALATQDDPDMGFVALGLGSGALAGYFLIHGLWSLTGGRPPPSHFAIGMAPREGGATLELGAAF